MGFDNEGLEGRQVHIYSEVGHLKNQGFDDLIESISTSGECRWLAYRAPNFEVYTYILRPNRLFHPVNMGWLYR